MSCRLHSEEYVLGKLFRGATRHDHNPSSAVSDQPRCFGLPMKPLVGLTSVTCVRVPGLPIAADPTQAQYIATSILTCL